MKKQWIFGLLCMLPLVYFAQVGCVSERYTKAVFNNITISKDIPYQQADAYDIFNINNPVAYKLDIYQPAGDPLQARPVVLMFYGGAFVLGDKGDADMTAWCDSLAHYGYVAVAVNYRLGFNSLSTGSAIRAVYRALQDARAAIRYLKEFHTLYKIDTTRMFIGGESAGAFIGLHTAYFDKEAERPSETYGITGENTNLGCLDCSGNTYQHTVEVKGVIDLWGALYDLNYIETGQNVPVLLIHGTDDAIVPYDKGHPFTGQFPSTFPLVYGSVPIAARLDSMGIYHEFYPYQGEGHVFYGLPTGVVTFPNDKWEPVWTQGHNFLYKIMQFPSPAPVGSTASLVNAIEQYTVPLNPSSTYCWQVVGGNIQSISPATHQCQVKWTTQGIGKVYVTEKNNVHMMGTTDSLWVNIAGVNAITGTFEQKYAPLLSPNPSQKEVALTLWMPQAMEMQLSIQNQWGQMVLQPIIKLLDAGRQQWAIPTTDLPTGVYFINCEDVQGNKSTLKWVKW